MYYKAISEDLQSIGLNRAIPIQYVVGEYVFPQQLPKHGLWVAKNKRFISWLRRYLKAKYNCKLRVFACEIGEVLSETSNRIETDKVKLVEEIL